MNEKKKLAVLFPGIGYTCDKPLLYYSAKLAIKADYEIVPVPYGNFPRGVKGNAEKMHQSFLLAGEQAEEILKDIRWSRYEDIVFVSKSIGTVVSSCYAAKKDLKVRSILFTPVEETFLYANRPAVAFHGTGDPWADTGKIRSACEKAGILLFLTEHANHSLETGDIQKDIGIMAETMSRVESFFRGDGIFAPDLFT